MKLSQLDYYLPKEYIANFPVSPRDSSKLLAIDRKEKSISHHIFNELADLINQNDVLVFNQTKVFPARLFGKRKTGGKAEVLLLKRLKNSTWEAITKPGFSVGDKIYFKGFTAEIKERDNYVSKVGFSLPNKDFINQLNKIGNVPLPPYIKSDVPQEKLKSQYQTVYAKIIGSAAAPTAGFHFTKKLFTKLKDKKIAMEFLTLHVGLGTFAPLKEERIEKHKIHEENFEINKSTIERLNIAKKAGKKIIAVGTTTARVLETLATKNSKLDNGKFKGYTNLFIYPPYKFKFVEGLITNFHLPKSTLLALVSAFTSYPNTKNRFADFKSSLLGRAYLEAIENNYRFFSFGDSNFIF